MALTRRALSALSILIIVNFDNVNFLDRYRIIFDNVDFLILLTGLTKTSILIIVNVELFLTMLTFYFC